MVEGRLEIAERRKVDDRASVALGEVGAEADNLFAVEFDCYVGQRLLGLARVSGCDHAEQRGGFFDCLASVDGTMGQVGKEVREGVLGEADGDKDSAGFAREQLRCERLANFASFVGVDLVGFHLSYFVFIMRSGIAAHGQESNDESAKSKIYFNYLREMFHANWLGDFSY